MFDLKDEGVCVVVFFKKKEFIIIMPCGYKPLLVNWSSL